MTNPVILCSPDGYGGEIGALADALNPPLRKAGVGGGTPSFPYDAERNELRVVSVYRCRRALTEYDLQTLVRETQGA